MSDPFAVLAGVQLRDVEGVPLLGAPSGFDLVLGWEVARHRRRERLEAVLRRFGCACPRCRVDAAHVLAGVRKVSV